ncbi:MAG: Hpt domain-containing protein, partial [Lachnospiraceae bacterium]|nr:Hpt domain-containing protein [Lachnospiraceae bacterium]
DFYLGLLHKFASVLDYDKVEETLKDGNFDEAFMLVHRMKGSSADLCLTPLSEVLLDLTDELRPKDHLPSKDMMELFKERATSFLNMVSDESGPI